MDERVFWYIVNGVVQFFDLVDNLWFQVFKFLEIKRTSGSGSGFFGNFQKIDSFHERTGKEPAV
jgi:hypothetical protein